MKQENSKNLNYAPRAPITHYDLSEEIVAFLNDIIIVEGAKDVISLQALGFTRVVALHVPNCSLPKRAEQIANIALPTDRVHILTDLDVRGKKMYSAIKPHLQQAGLHLSTKLRALLLIYGISHVEGLYQFLRKNEINLTTV